MRLDEKHIRQLKRLAVEEAGPDARLLLFGSRLDDNARGGDVDLLLEVSTPVANPAALIARVAARASRAMEGRHVDVVLAAPNLKHLPIHDTAMRCGVEVVSMQRDDLHARLQFLARVVNRECKHLGTTDKGIFGAPFTTEHAKRLEKGQCLRRTRGSIRQSVWSLARHSWQQTIAGDAASPG